MNTKLVTLSIAGALVQSLSAQVWINEVLPNAPGSDTGNEYFELRGAPNMSLTGYYLISLEGQGAGKGDVNQFFDLSAFSIGANGYLFARQVGSQFAPTATGATVIDNSIGTGWGQVNGAGSSVGHHSDAAQVDIENGATTILLVNIGTGQPPDITMDLDLDNDLTLDLPEGWTVVDSVGIMDGSGAAATDATYAAIAFYVEGQLGTNVFGNMISIPGPMTTTAGTFHVGRKGESTGSTSNDWFGSVLQGSAASPLNFYFISSSDDSYTARLVSDMVYGGPNPVPDPPGTKSYTPTIHGNRFTNYTEVVVGGSVGAVTVDPRDNKTILFTQDSAAGGIFKATKVADGTWSVEETPIAPGLDRPSGMVIQTNGTLWWVHDVTMALMRLKEPWTANTPETVITNFGYAVGDDDPIDLTITPPTFNGSIGRPNWVAIADRGCDDNAQMAVLQVDPDTAPVFDIYANFLVPPTPSGLGWGDLNAIDSLPVSGELVTLSADGFITAVDGNGYTRYILPTTFWPLGSTPAGAALAVDPLGNRIWVADDTLDEIWSIDPSLAGQTADRKELTFPLTDPAKTYRAIDFHDPGMAFAPNGDFLVVADSNTAGGGGRLLIFHNEAHALPSFKITSATKTEQGIELNWEAAGSAKYVVQRASNVADPAGFQDVSDELTVTRFTDTNSVDGRAFYRVIVRP